MVEGTHLLHRAINTAPVNGVRHEEVRNPVQVYLGWHSPSGGLVLVYLRQDLDLPLRGLGQVCAL